MKKSLLLSLSFCILAATSAYAIRENKIIRVGYVNYAKLVEKIDQDGKIQKQVDDSRKNYQNKIQSLTREVENLQEIVSSNSNVNNIEQNIDELEQKSLDLALLKIKATQDIEKITLNAFNKVSEKIKPAIKNIAKRQNFDIIIDSSLILLASPALDITNFVLASL